MDLERMRGSKAYALALDRWASGAVQRRIGLLGDQSLYTQLTGSHPRLFHTLGCEWNRQLSMHFGFGNATTHRCPRRCGLLHANWRPAKCIAHLFQRNPTCERWTTFVEQLTNQSDPNYLRCPHGYPFQGGRDRPPLRPIINYRNGLARFFADCCKGTPMQPEPFGPPSNRRSLSARGGLAKAQLQSYARKYPDVARASGGNLKEIQRRERRGKKEGRTMPRLRPKKEFLK